MTEMTNKAEYRKSAEDLITAACYMAAKETGRKLRNHWIDRFNEMLAEHERKFPREKSDAA